MSGIRGKDTKPEIGLRKALFARGLRYRLHVPDLPGKPDIVFPRYRAALFVHGCFWHMHNCPLFRMPSTREEFWRKKLESNRRRDIMNIRALLQSGWRVLIVWECAFKRAGNEQLCRVADMAGEWIRASEKAPMLASIALERGEPAMIPEEYGIGDETG